MVSVGANNHSPAQSIFVKLAGRWRIVLDPLLGAKTAITTGDMDGR